MPAIPDACIFHDQPDGVFLVVNWRERIQGGRAPVLLRLSQRHLVRYRELQARGRGPKSIYYLLFLPPVRLVPILTGPPAALPLDPALAIPGWEAGTPVLAPALPEPPLAAPAPTDPSAAAADPAPVAGAVVAIAALPAASPSPGSAQAPPRAPPARVRPTWRARLRRQGVGWALSAGSHGLALLAMCSVCWVLRHPEEPLPPLRSQVLVAAEVPVPPTVAAPVTDLAPAVDDGPMAPSLPTDDRDADEAVPDAPPSPDPDLPARSARFDPLPEIPSRGMLGIGGGTHRGGLFGPRGSQRRHAALARYGGTAASQTAVDAALRWFKRHQSRNGSWNSQDFAYVCATFPRCEPGPRARGAAQALSFDCAMTGCALLCYLGAGYDHVTPSRYQPVVRRGVDWLIAAQGRDGYWGESNYTNAIATMALCEALVLSNDRRLIAPAQGGVRAILRHQNRHDPPADADVTGDRFGWDYVGPDDRNDASVSGWNIMALHSARRAGLDVGGGLDGAISWLDTTWRATNPRWQQLDPERDRTRFPYCFETVSGHITIGPEGAPFQDLTSVGAVAAAFLPHRGADLELATLARSLVEVQLPSPWLNPYYTYYASLALFQLGGTPWQRWNPRVRDRLVKTQRRGQACYDGSWDDDLHSFSRLFSTALSCLTLEVYYRYDRADRSAGVAAPTRTAATATGPDAGASQSP